MESGPMASAVITLESETFVFPISGTKVSAGLVELKEKCMAALGEYIVSHNISAEEPDLSEASEEDEVPDEIPNGSRKKSK